MRPGRLRERAKWAGVAVCAALVFVWAASAARTAVISPVRGGALIIENGRASWAAWDTADAAADRYAPRSGLGPTASNIPAFRWRFDRVSIGGITLTAAPLWPVALMAIVATAWLFLTGLRVPPGGVGRCGACGYDLTGAPTPTCPECGAKARAADRP